MSTRVDFASLSLRDALDLAILIEEEAQERYAEFVDQMQLHHTPEAAAFFRAMAGNEARHGAELSARRNSLFRDEPRLVKQSMLWEVEAPDYDQTRAFMSVRQAMEVALQSEIKAHEFFVHALDYIADPEVRSLFEELRDEELVHQSLVRNQLDLAPPDPVIDPSAFADEPTAQ
ncbi:MAG TPA: ferritin family protein [Acidobacteriota bacterium]|nr:ferritin family protein [Acidobacteriota bacterium]